jgi:hypothetical protein
MNITTVTGRAIDILNSYAQWRGDIAKITMPTINVPVPVIHMPQIRNLIIKRHQVISKPNLTNPREAAKIISTHKPMTQNVGGFEVSPAPHKLIITIYTVNFTYLKGVTCAIKAAL